MKAVLNKKEAFEPYHRGPLQVVEPIAGVNQQAVQQVLRERFVNAMAHAVNGVNVVTTDGHAGQFGLTVSSATSVSADPPMMLVCINRGNPTGAAVRNNGVFCINMLSIKQSKTAELFAGRQKLGKPYDFNRVDWEQGMTGSPYLSKALANFDCVVEKSIEAGSHTIFIGRVVATVAKDAAPLLYSNRTYGFPYLIGQV